MAEFLPLCDLLFNIVSLAAYFCDVVFDLLMVYALYDTGPTIMFVQCVMAIVISSIVTQLVSINWHFKRKCKKDKTKGITENVVIAIHVLQLAMLWRYAKLLAPVKLEYVKKDVRDLCVLRLIHAFLQAAPMLLLQLSLLPAATSISNAPRVGPPADLVVVSAALSLFTVCWALASFSKHVQAVDRLILTWLGVVSQLLWRAGTVSARALALSAYAATYHSWIFLVLALHWSCMFLWLVSPRSAFYGEKGKRLGLCFLLAAVYVFTYVNLQNKPHIRTMTVFYVVMLLENVLLVSAWLAAVWGTRPTHWVMIPILTVGLFLAGLFFMILYYRYFHVRRLLKPNNPEGISLDNKQLSNPQSNNNHNQQTPGVFNCRFAAPSGSSAAYRKKKKPTSFVPPPNLREGISGTNQTSGGITIFGGNGTAMAVAVPFWRRPLPSSSENEGSSVGSRVNIHQKLQEKKQKQLAELKIIEEEIKQGKLGGPDSHLLHHISSSVPGNPSGDPNTSSFLNSNDHLLLHHHRNRQPIPRTKRHMEPQLISLASLNNLASYGVNLNRSRPPPLPPQPRGVPPMNVGNNQGRSRTPPTELLLAPRYLYYDVSPNVTRNHDQVGPRNGLELNEPSANLGSGDNLGVSQVGGNSNDGGSNSDIESQLSLPRSYTLPREFKYHRRGGGHPSRRPLTAVASNNSSDGDVDSAGDESDSCYNSPAPPVVVCPIRRPFRHETKL